MKNQVTSIEQSRRLIGLGVPAEKASMGWFEEMECNAAEEWQVPDYEYHYRNFIQKLTE